MLPQICAHGVVAYFWAHISWAHIFDHGRKLMGACCMGAYFLLWAHIAGRIFHGRIIAMVGANVTEFYTLPKTLLYACPKRCANPTSFIFTFLTLLSCLCILYLLSMFILLARSKITSSVALAGAGLNVRM